MDPISPFLHSGVAVGAVVIAALLTVKNTLLAMQMKALSEEIKGLLKRATDATDHIPEILKTLASMSADLDKATDERRDFSNDLVQGQQVLANNQLHITDVVNRVMERLLSIVESIKD